MKLIKTQIAWLRNSWRSKDTRPNFWKVFWSVRKAWLSTIPMILFGVWEFEDNSPVLGCILISVAWGIIFASILLSARTVSLWPVFRDVTNWERVQTLIREDEGENV